MIDAEVINAAGPDFKLIANFGNGVDNIDVAAAQAKGIDPDMIILQDVPDELKGHKPVAFVVRARGAGLDEQAVKDYALANAPAYQHPRRVFFVDEMPLAGTNKIDKRVLAKQIPADALSS